jgi:hypothetical protein
MVVDSYFIYYENNHDNLSYDEAFQLFKEINYARVL